MPKFLKIVRRCAVLFRSQGTVVHHQRQDRIAVLLSLEELSTPDAFEPRLPDSSGAAKRYCQQLCELHRTSFFESNTRALGIAINERPLRLNFPSYAGHVSFRLWLNTTIGLAL